MDPSISLMQQQELGQILCLGDVPTRWTRSSHFHSPEGDCPPPGVPTCYGPSHNGEGHFVTFFMCADYRSILDPLTDYVPTPTCIRYKLYKATRESFASRNIPAPALPPFRQLIRIATQRDTSLPLWPCGTFAIANTLQLLLAGRPLHSLPANYITRDHILALHIALCCEYAIKMACTRKVAHALEVVVGDLISIKHEFLGSRRKPLTH